MSYTNNNLQAQTSNALHNAIIEAGGKDRPPILAPGTVKFGNDQIASILGYGDLVQGNINIEKVCYVKELNHNLFFIGQLCDSDLDVAFRKSICYILDLKGNDLLTNSRGTDLYSITLQDTSTPNPICLMAKALPKLKFIKDHLCSSCELGKAKCKSFKTKTTPSSKRRLQILHMDLCGPVRVESFNGKKYVLAEAIPIACFTQNRSLVIPRHAKTPYHIINGQKPSIKFFYIFGSLCYIVRDGENLNKMKEKGDACILLGYSTQSRAYRVYDKRTRVIVETIHVNFDELPQIASDNVSFDLVSQCPTTALEQDNLSPGPQSQENVTHAAETVTTSYEIDLLFSLMFDELFNGTTLIVSKSSFVHAADALDERQQHNTTPSTSTTIAADTPPLNIQTTPDTTNQAPTQELTIHQSSRGIFINQAKYAQEILKKYGMTSCDSIGTPMATKPIDANLSGTPVDQTKYHSMVGVVMYLTASRSDIVHATCHCARYQVRPTEKHLKEVKRVFRYLKNTINMGLWYPKDIGFELTAFSDLDHAGCIDSRKSTSSGIQFLGGDKLASWSSKKQDCTSMSIAKAEYVSLSACCTQVL
nr:uncharacterized mitochondrial protein AtMg00810-like [Tanacetum cinerariifolium]